MTIGATSALVHLVKLFVGRARPELFAEYGAYSLTPFAYDDLYSSFPSGHSAAVGAFFGAFSMLAPRLRPLFLLGALTIVWSRRERTLVTAANVFPLGPAEEGALQRLLARAICD